MAELEFKYLNEIDISDSLTDSAHIIVEDGGNIRRAPMSQLITGGGVSSWNDLGYHYIALTWDGSTEGREAYVDESFNYYKISDTYIPAEHFIGGMMEVAGADALGIPSEIQFDESFIAGAGEGFTAIGFPSFFPLIYSFTPEFVAGEEELSSLSGGTYILLAKAEVLSEMFPDAVENGVVFEKDLFASKLKVIDDINLVPEEFLPEINALPEVTTENNGNVLTVVDGAWTASKATISEQVQPDWNQSDETAADYVKNRTHWEENNQTVIEWDNGMDASGSDSFEYGSSTFVKVSGITPTVSELDSAIISMTASGNTQSFSVKEQYGDSSNWWEVQDKLINFGGMVMIAYDTNITDEVTNAPISIPSKGTYFNTTMLGQFGAEQLSLTYGSTAYHPLDEKFIPNTIARIVDIPEINYPVTSINGMTGDVQIDISNQVQADWNQNDDNEIDYIKNRTHWEEFSTNVETIIDNRTLTLSSGQNSNSETYSTANLTDITTTLVTGKKYILTIDEVEYISEAKEMVQSGLTLTYLGNPSITGGSNFENTGESYFLASMDLSSYGQGLQYSFGISGEASSATISLSKETIINTVHPLNAKYLPKEAQSDWDESDNLSINFVKNKPLYRNFTRETIYSGIISFSNNNTYEELGINYGEPYTISWNGVEYPCKYYQREGYIEGCGYWGNYSLYDSSEENTGEPFVIICDTYDSEARLFKQTSDAESITIIVYKDSTNYNIDSDWVPMFQSDWTENDESSSLYIKNRPFYAEGIEQETFENQNLAFAPDSSGTTYTAQLDPFITVYEDSEYIVNWDGAEYNCTSVITFSTDTMKLITTGNLSIVDADAYPDSGEPFLIMTYSTDEEQTHSIGTLDTASSHSVIVTGPDVLYHKIDKKFLPSDINQQGSSLPTVTEDDDGKILRVSGGKWIVTSLVNTEEVSY